MFELYSIIGDMFHLVSSHESIDDCHNKAKEELIDKYVIEINYGSTCSQVFKSEILEQPIEGE